MTIWTLLKKTFHLIKVLIVENKGNIREEMILMYLLLFMNYIKLEYEIKLYERI